MNITKSAHNKDAEARLSNIIELLDIPPSYYKRAEQRYRSLADWLSREASSVKNFQPRIYPQGSFRYGTVIRPLLDHLRLSEVCFLE